MSNWSVDPLLVWGLYPRGLGLVLFISFLSLSGQVVPIAGKGTGVGSVARRMAQIRDDFPSARRFLYFPTLLWFNSSDAMLRLLTWVGLASAALVIYGGPWSSWAMASCYICYLSLDLPMGLVFPWDCVLLESTFVSMFLPPTHALPQLAAVALPAPALTWVYRLLVFRVMFGFGKQKFLGSRSKDSAYLRGFLMYQPLLSPAAWYAHKLPLFILKAGVVFMFIVEIPAPFGALFPGPFSVITALLTVLLVMGIQLLGNFGYFSMLTVAACLPLLDNTTPLTLSISHMFDRGAPWFVNAFVVLHTLSTSVVFSFNSWLGQGWTLWSVWYRLPRWTQPVIGFYRLAQPFRWLHPYGVFPPNNQPGVKMALLPEVSWDGKQWHELHFEFAPNNERSLPHFVAPHHPRGDQAIVYDTFGLNANSLMGGLLGPWDPYYYASSSPALEFCQKLVENKPVKLAQLNQPSQHSGPPSAARITTMMLEPTTIAERRQTGRVWKRTYVGPHTPTHAYDPDFYQYAYGEPELWHPECIAWRRRSRFNALMKRACTGREDPLSLAIWDGRLTAAAAELFWNDLVPMVTRADRATFDSVPALRDAVNRQFARAQRRVLARMLGRFSLILLARFEPFYLYRGSKPDLSAQTYLHLWMLAQHIIAQGKQAYLAAYAEPLSCKAQLASMTNQNGLYFNALFRFDEMCFEAQKLRLLNSVAYPHDNEQKRVNEAKRRATNLNTLSRAERFIVRGARTLSGFFCIMDDLRRAFIGPAFDRGFPELNATFQELDSGDIRLASYAYPEPNALLAPDLKSLQAPITFETDATLAGEAAAVLEAPPAPSERS